MLNPLNLRSNIAPSPATPRTTAPAPEATSSPQESVALSKGPQETFGKPQIHSSAVTAPQQSPARLGKTARLVALAVALTAAGGMLTGCGKALSPDQLGPAVAQQTVQQDHDQALRFELVPQNNRVDIIRQTHEEESCSGSGKDYSCTTTTVDDPYQPMGVYLGKGMFLDADMNLSIVPDRVFHGPLIPQDFKQMTLQGPFGSWSKATMRQEGNTVGISQSLNFFDNKVTRDNPDQTTLSLGTFKALQKFNNVIIQRHGDDIDIQEWAPNIKLLKDAARVEIRTHGNEVTVHPFGWKTLVDTKITYEGDKVTVQAFGGKLSRTEITQKPNSQEIDVNHWGIGSEVSQRGTTGFNETSKGLGLHSTTNVQISGNQYDIHEPGPFSHTTIKVDP